MTENNPTGHEPSEDETQQQSAARRNRGVRFSDSEWEEVKRAAQHHGVTPAEFVRDEILDLIRAPAAAGPTPFPTHLAPLIERTFRYTYMLATKMRDDMIDGGFEQELNTLIAEAQKLQDELRRPDSD